MEGLQSNPKKEKTNFLKKYLVKAETEEKDPYINSWSVQIEPNLGFKGLNLKEIYNFRDLIFLFVKRDFVVFYKQTVLGPLWYIIQPLIYSLVFTLVFGNIASIPTDGVPPFIFYLAGNVLWGYFAVAFTGTSKIFVTNAQIFGKVYFPRITVPISVCISSLIQFFVQFLIFLGFLFYFKSGNSDIAIDLTYLVLVPLVIIQIATLSIGVGCFISSITAKYKDLVLAFNLLVQLWMYLSPVVYPLSEVPEKYKIFMLLNPMTMPLEVFKHAFLGVGEVSTFGILLSLSATIFMFILGILIFNRTEKTFMDTV